ncbi:MAG: PDZ domain-containing protein [Rhabdochlamydiaceae bacterium]
MWVYAPAQLGLRFDDGNFISSFNLNSDAKKAGVKVGDKIIGIDGYDIFDEKVIHHFMDIHPGDKVTISLLRGSKQLEYQITALAN